jgi:hypothetical protein
LILYSFDGSEFELTIVRGRQWNPHATDWADFDWVSVHIRALAPFGTFNDGGPGILNRELIQLASWFADIAQSKDILTEFLPIEGWFPRFELKEQEDRFVTISIKFIDRYYWSFVKELLPPDNNPEFPCVDIEISRNQLQVAANQLRAEHDQLPRYWT